MGRSGYRGLLVAAALLAAGCDEDKSREQAAAPEPAAGPIEAATLPTPSDPLLARGRQVWAGTCQACHGTGMNDAPKITDRKAWAPRIAKGLETLTGHALSGFTGPMGTRMPARGGNAKLTDDEIKAAVAFMVSQSR